MVSGRCHSAASTFTQEMQMRRGNRGNKEAKKPKQEPRVITPASTSGLVATLRGVPAPLPRKK